MADGTVRCIDSEIPFDIPKGWEWCRFGSLSFNRDYERIPLSVSERNGLDKLYDYYGASGVIDKVDKYLFDKPLLLIGEDGANLVNRSTPIAFIATGRYWVNNHAHVIDFISDSLMKYMCNYINAISLTDYVTGTAQPKMNQEKMNSILVAVPPMHEQIRINEQLTIILPIIAKHNRQQNVLDHLNRVISENIRKSILQEAIQGRLVPQIESEGTAEELLSEIHSEKLRLVKEGKLKKSALANDSRIFRGEDNRYYENINGNVTCIDNELPFEIPKSWTWIRLDNICVYIQRGKSPKYSQIKKIPVVAQKCNQWSGFSIEKAQFIEPTTLSSYGEERFLQNGDLMWNSTGLGTLGRMAIYSAMLNPYGIAVADSHVTVIRPCSGKISSDYLFAYFSSNTVQTVIEDKSDGSTKQKELSTTTVKNYLVPLPPYDEQCRIVDKIKTLTGIMSR